MTVVLVVIVSTVVTEHRHGYTHIIGKRVVAVVVVAVVVVVIWLTVDLGSSGGVVGRMDVVICV